MRRRGLLIASGLGVVALLAPLAAKTPPLLVWNASASAPIGLYLVRPMRRPVRGALAVIMPPTPLSRFAAERRYLPLGLPLIKPVAATAGHRVCRTGRTVRVDDRPIGRALTRDSRGRPLPVWRGCHALGPGEVFVMNPAVRDSFDGRYFGLLPISTVLGRARPLWTEAASINHSRS